MAFHTVTDFIGGLWRNNKETPQDFDDEWDSQEQWKRDFEEGADGIIGEMRQRIRRAKREARLPANGLHIRVRGLEYTSPPLKTEISTISNFLIQHFNLYRRLKNRFYPDPSKQRKLLSNINFTIKEGSMTLVIGSPGSGKSSLCKILANQEITGTQSGEILLGGQQIQERDHSHRVAYVRDCDTHLAHLTVRETFEFAYAMLTHDGTAEERERRVSVIMQVLGLTHRANTIVGDDLTRGVSGGERRRVTIGVELLKRCQLLVLDEATTGLDSTTSLQIFRALRIFADEVAPVFATLKQPGRDLLELFDNVIVMHEGHIIYSGAREEMMQFFESHGFPVHHTINPADEVLAIVDKYGSKLIELSKKQEENEEDEAEAERADLGAQISYKKFSRSWFAQFGWGVKRGFQLIKNNPGISVSRVIFAIIMSLIIGSIFFQQGDNQASIQSIQGAFFMVSTFPAFQALAGLPTVFAMRPVFYYQKKNNYYHAVPIQIAEFISSLPVTLIESFVFSTICYWMIGMNSLFVRYVYFVLMVLCLEVLFSIITKIAGFILPSFLIANILVPPMVFMQTFFSGFAITQDRAPEYMQWIFWVTPFRYLLEGLSINQFLDETFVCDDDEFLPPTSDKKLNLPFSLGGYESNQMCPLTTGEQILLGNDYETDAAYKWYWFAVLMLYIIVAFFVMIVSSHFEYKKKLPRNLRDMDEKRIQQNTKLIGMKDSLRMSLRNSSSSDNEDSNSEDSAESFNSFLDLSSKGKRIDTHLPIYLQWKDLSYTVKVLPSTGIFSILGNFPIIKKFVQEDLKLLDGVSGYVKPGMLMAFMGPSGAGKTTLLDVLSLRKTAGTINGEILVNGAPLDPETLPRFSGYVEQNNIHIETETIEEALKMSAALRLCYPAGNNRSISRKERLEHILWVMDVLSLTHIRGALISELSLEQKKRVTIAVELAANPSLLWLDEPTSGLDAMAALKVMQAVKAIADSGVAVVCTLHQPSELLFSWCSHLLLLSPGGKVAYFGDTSDACHEIKEHFSQFNLQAETNQNAADFFLDCVASSNTNHLNQNINEAYKESPLYNELQTELEQGLVPRIPIENSSWYQKIFPCFSKPIEQQDDTIVPPTYDSRYARNLLVQWIYVASRNVRKWWRSPLPIFIMFLNATLFGLLLGLLFSERDDSQQGAQENVAVFFFLNLVFSTSVMTFIPQIFGERAVFYRETSAKAYNKVVYMISMILVAFLLLTISSLIVTGLTWSIADLTRDWNRVGYLIGIGCLTPIVSYGFAFLLSSIAPVPELGNGLFSIVNILNALTNGFLLIRTEIPVYWIWAYWAGYQHYSLEALLLNGLTGENFYCHNNEGAVPVPVPSADDPDRVQFYCPIRTGEDILDSMEVHEGWELPDILVLCGFVCLLFTISAFFISKLKHIQR